jgi:glycine C-acetyltransferase
MYAAVETIVEDQLRSIRDAGLYKSERVLTTPQGTEVRTAPTGDRNVINLCSNNYLGLASDKQVVEAACEAMQRWGFGLSSVRFICGTQQIHKELEQAVSDFLTVDDTLLYAACFDANGGVFEPLLGEDDAVISDELNHASLIDGIRLTKAKRLRYRHGDMEDLKRCLEGAAESRMRMIATDGVFSMDGDIARLDEICSLADRYEALVLVDDSHATGYIGKGGRGTPELTGTQTRVDLITTTFGKALGGAGGGCISGRQGLIDLMRQRSRPYLFSNTLSPAVVGGTLQVLRMLSGSSELRDRLTESARGFRKTLQEAGFTVLPGETAIIPVMLYDESSASRMADELLEEGVYVIGFSCPVVPRGKARIRVQISAAHTQQQLDEAAAAFIRVGRRMGLIG